MEPENQKANRETHQVNVTMGRMNIATKHTSVDSYTDIPGIPCFIAFHLIAFCRCCIFYKLRFCGNPASNKFIIAILPIAFAYFVSL